jgi:ribosomal protein L29
MKSKEKKQLVGKAVSELITDIKRVQAEILNIHLEKIQGKLKNTSSLTTKRKEIALMKTILRAKEMNNESI